MSDFQPFELKFWRKRHGLSQGEFAKLSGLAPMTIDKIETELHQVQERTLIKLTQAVRDYEASVKKKTPELETHTDPTDDVAVRDNEASLKKETQSTEISLEESPVVSIPTPSKIKEAYPSEISERMVAPSEVAVKISPPQVVLSNLDLELITRILTMTPIEKVSLLKSLIE